MPTSYSASISVVIPCHNEEGAIGQVVSDFKEFLPGADILVIDNCSTDNTSNEARNSGAQVITEPKRGKGNAIRQAFSSVTSDIVVMVDGDGTYDASAVPDLIGLLIREKLEMAIGVRRPAPQSRPYPWGHNVGNRLLSWIIKPLFGRKITDAFSGYRAFTKRFVKSFPALSQGFEIETELNIYALSLELKTQEIPTYYFERLGNTKSKLRTFRDGFIILTSLVKWFCKIRPMRFWGLLSAMLITCSAILSVPTWELLVQQGHAVPTLTNILCAASLLGAIGALCWGRRQSKIVRRNLAIQQTTYYGHS